MDILRLFGILLYLVAPTKSDVPVDDGRRRRQLPTEINIQVTAPLFNARLYDYGPGTEDIELPAGLDVSRQITLQSPITFYGERYDSVYISSNGVIGFDQSSRQFSAELFPQGPTLIAPFFNRNNFREGGKVYYREVTDGRIIERAESEVRYQYEKRVEPFAVLLATWENMIPLGDRRPDQNNTFQIAILTSNNGTYANIVYKDLGWHQAAQAGFNKGDGRQSFALPFTTGNQKRPYSLKENGNTGIPGEWMFQIDMPRIISCLPGRKGDTCEQPCGAQEWGYDCADCCHCQNGTCNKQTGACQNPVCADCWGPAPTCNTRDSGCRVTSHACGHNAISFTDYGRCGEPLVRCQCLSGYQGDGITCDDVDECTRQTAKCDSNAMCVNTPGRYYCECLEGFNGDGASCTSEFLYSFNNHQPLPRLPNSRVHAKLQQPLNIFGRERQALYINSNGIVTMDDVVPSIDQDLEHQGVHGLSPYFARIDLTKGGQVSVEELTTTDVLTRATKVVQKHFNPPGFLATSVLVLTFDDVKSVSQDVGQVGNTYQMLLIGGKNQFGESLTFVEYLYKNLTWTEDAQVAVLSDDAGYSVILPGSGSDGVRQLTRLSNIQEPGQWMFRVDASRISPCPNASLLPPYCTELGVPDDFTHFVPPQTLAPLTEANPNLVTATNRASVDFTAAPPSSFVPSDTPPTAQQFTAASQSPIAAAASTPFASPAAVTADPTSTVAAPQTTIRPRIATTEDYDYVFSFPPFITILPQLVTSPRSRAPSSAASERPIIITVPSAAPATTASTPRPTPVTAPPATPSRATFIPTSSQFHPPLTSGSRPEPPAHETPQWIPIDFLTNPAPTTTRRPRPVVATSRPPGPGLQFINPSPDQNTLPTRPQLVTHNSNNVNLVTAGNPPLSPRLNADANPSRDDDLSSPSKLAITIPTAIVAVWLLLLVVIGAVVCCRRQRDKRRLRTRYEPYNLFRAGQPGGRGKEPASAAGMARTSSYEDHLDKAGRLSELNSYNQNPRAMPTMYSSYWGVPPARNSANYYNQGYYESCPEFSRYGFNGRF